MTLLRLGFQVCILLVFAACSNHQLFEKLNFEDSGISFTNVLSEDSIHNMYTYTNIYTGAGVSIGDINNDKLPDIYFSGNEVLGKLYLNKGNLQFEDITESAGLLENRWGTGTSMVDINQDGYLDLYICVSGSPVFGSTQNLLYINNGDLTFSEEADNYGIADSRSSIHSSFFDFDGDTDLDLFLIINPYDASSEVAIFKPKLVNRNPKSIDVLYRNNGDNTFTDISSQAGILEEGYSLGIAVGDFNSDDFPDIYISNDFVSDDLLYISNGDGTFTNKIKEFFTHTSFASMGSDLADINNDGLLDLYVADMLPEDNKRQKMLIGPVSYDKFIESIKMDYNPQYTRNTLQINNGINKYKDISFLSGVSNTDWSWSTLFADFDNDNDKDLFVGNGFYRDLGNLDYIHFQESPYGGIEKRKERKLKRILELKQSPLKDYMFEQIDSIQFIKRSDDWGFNELSFSNGAAYADLDLDGDVDLVVNRLNEKSVIFKNKANTLLHRNNFLQLDITFIKGNLGGIGSKIWLWCAGEIQYYEHHLSRGFESSVDHLIHFGLGEITKVDSIIIRWPNGNFQKILNPEPNRVIDWKYNESLVIRTDYKNAATARSTFFTERNELLMFDHKENEFSDYKRQPILSRMHSKEGPAIAVADVNGDGLDDIFLGGSFGSPNYLYTQTNHGFKADTLLTETTYEDVDAIFFDADNDGDQDLYIVSGGSELDQDNSFYRDRFLENINGILIENKTAFPELLASGSVVISGDYDADGDEDLFVGSRVIPGSYPLTPKSYLLRNESNGKIKFVNATIEQFSNSGEIGMITDAVFADYNNDQKLDLITVGEFDEISVFENQGNKFVYRSNEIGLKETHGWWESIAAGDFDNDGDIDFIAGNYGINSTYKASKDELICIYASDYDNNGLIDPVMCYYIDGINYVAHTRDNLIKQIPAIRYRFKTYQSFAELPFDDAFLPSEIDDAFIVKCETTKSVILENDNGKFTIYELPLQAQVAPIRAILVKDLDLDGNLDILLSGNENSTEGTLIGRMDAFDGLFLKGNGTMKFTANPPAISGFITPNFARDIQYINIGNDPYIIVANNSNKAQLFKIK